MPSGAASLVNSKIDTALVRGFWTISALDASIPAGTRHGGEGTSLRDNTPDQTSRHVLPGIPKEASGIH